MGVRMLRSVILLLLVFGLSGCTTKTGPAGPYDVVPGMSRADVEMRLGKPTRIGEGGRITTWFYEEQGLEIGFSTTVAVQISQTKGRVTKEISIGDREARVISLAGDARTLSNGTKVVTLREGKFTRDLFMRQGKLAESLLMLPIDYD